MQCEKNVRECSIELSSKLKNKYLHNYSVYTVCAQMRTENLLALVVYIVCSSAKDT